MKATKTALAALAAAWMAIASIAAEQTPPQNLEGSLALKGYDPVSYHQGEPKKGSERWTATHDGARYRFASKGNLETFLDDPETYVPRYGGYCAYAMMDDGELVDADPETYSLIGGRLYLFYNGFWGNTLEQWNEAAAKRGEERMVAEADRHWKALVQDG